MATKKPAAKKATTPKPATAKKAAAPKSTAAKKAPAAKKTGAVARFPKKELTTWLKGRESWNHQDWLDLIAGLRDQGFAKWTDSQEGCDAIGLYLETNRKKG